MEREVQSLLKLLELGSRDGPTLASASLALLRGLGAADHASAGGRGASSPTAAAAAPWSNTPRRLVPDVVPAATALAALQHALPAGLVRPQAIAVLPALLAAGQPAGFGAEVAVPVDPLVALVVLLSNGDLDEQLDMVAWALDR
jgi:hypothetical protein